MLKIQDLQSELQNAYNADLDENQANALLYYDGEPGQVAAGWSDLVSTDLRSAMESTMAEVMGSIDPNETLARFTPMSEEDVLQSELESDAVHDIIFNRNRGSLILETAFRDALLQRYGITKVAHNAETGQITLYNVPPENFRWSRDLQSPFLSEARFCAERVYYTREELEDVKKLAYTRTPGNDSMTAQARNPTGGSDKAARQKDDNIECWICWLRNSKNGFDMALINGNDIIYQEERPYLPYAAGVTTIRPHRFDGVSLYDTMGQIQKAKTYFIRQLATQTRLASQTRVAIQDKTVNPDDLVSDALNPVIRCTSPPGNVILPLPIQDVTTQILNTLQWLDGLRRDDGGASIDMASPQMTVANASAHATEREYSFRELEATKKIRTFGETWVRSLYLLVHSAVRGQAKPMMVNKKFIDPVRFPARLDLDIDLGTTQGTKNRRLAALANLIQQQMVVLQGGGAGVLVATKNLYKAQIDFAKLSGLPMAERYWTDPMSEEGMEAAKQAAMAAQAKAAQEADLVNTAAQKDIIIQHMENEKELQKTKIVTRQKYFDSILKSEADGRALDFKEVELVANLELAEKGQATKIPDLSPTMPEDEVGENNE